MRELRPKNSKRRGLVFVDKMHRVASSNKSGHSLIGLNIMCTLCVLKEAAQAVLTVQQSHENHVFDNSAKLALSHKETTVRRKIASVQLAYN